MISAVIYNALVSLANGHIYPSAFPQPSVNGPGTVEATQSQPSWPAIRYTVIDAQNPATSCGTGTVDNDDTTVQIDVVAKTYGGMTTLRDQVIAALMATDPPCKRDNYFETKDTETKTHRAVLTYSFYASTPSGTSP